MKFADRAKEMCDEIMRAEIYAKAVETKKRNAEATEEEMVLWSLC